jgi:hypothetical protein
MRYGNNSHIVSDGEVSISVQKKLDNRGVPGVTSMMEGGIPFLEDEERKG